MTIAMQPVTGKGQLKQGDFMLIRERTGQQRLFPAEVKDVIVDADGVEEIVFSRTRNRYFNVDMLLSGESWVKEVVKVPGCQATVAISNLREH